MVRNAVHTSGASQLIYCQTQQKTLWSHLHGLYSISISITVSILTASACKFEGLRQYHKVIIL